MIIDVSEHNGNIDWQKVKGDGVTGAIIRCGYGKDLKKQDDKKFTRNMDGAINAGLDIGVYLYSYATNANGAKSEAEHVLRLIDPYKEKINLPVYYDLEESGTENAAKANAVVFGDIIEKAGYWCGVYASLSWWATDLYGLDRFTKWVAAWGKNNGKPGTKPTISGCDLWQYTSKGKINGISGNVDCNELLNTKIRTEKGHTSAPSNQTGKDTQKPTNATEGQNNANKTYTVKKGDMLTAIAAKYGVTVNSIVEANGIKNPNLIYAGQKLTIPTGGNVKTYLTVNTEKSGLNMRNKPGMVGGVVQVIPKGAKVELIQKTNADWYNVRYNGKTGYCASKYLKA